MSIRVMTRVWDHSTATGGTLLILLAIADFADDRGLAYPGMDRLAEKARLNPRNAQRAVRRLERTSELEVKVGAGPRGCNLFRVLLADAQQQPLGVALEPGAANRHPVAVASPGGGDRDSKGVAPAPPEPSVDPSGSVKGTGAPEARTPREISPGQEVKLITAAVVDRWRELRKKHFAGRGHFDDAQAIAGLKKAVTRALAAGCTAGDLAAGLLAHGDDPKGNPWYADEWANLARAKREEAEAFAFKKQDRREADRLAQQADEAKWQALEAAHPGMTRIEIAKSMLRRDRGFQHAGALAEAVVGQVRAS